jgi:hypothetical protein
MPEKDKMTLHNAFLGINNSNKSNTLLFLAKAKCYIIFYFSEYQLFVKRDDVTIYYLRVRSEHCVRLW